MRFIKMRGNTPLCNLWVPLAIIATLVAMMCHPREMWQMLRQDGQTGV